MDDGSQIKAKKKPSLSLSAALCHEFSPRKMDRTLAVERVPPRRVCSAVELSFKTYLSCRIVRGMANQSLCNLPCRSTGCAPHHIHTGYPAINNFHLKLRCTKYLSISAKTILPWKTTSGGGSRHPFRENFLSGRNNRNFFFSTERHKIL